MLFCVRTGAAILEVKLFTAPGVHISKFGQHLRVFISFLTASFKILQGHVWNSLITRGMEHTTYTFQKRCGSVVDKVNCHRTVQGYGRQRQHISSCSIFPLRLWG